MPAGSSVRCPYATAQWQIAEMRYLTRRAVSRLSVQIGSGTDTT